MKKTGLFFGSFNPIHVGHLIIANSLLQNTDIEQVWFVVSPQNPHKDKKILLPEYQRLQMVELAIEDNFNFRSSDIEFKLPKPSYTIHTLTYLHEKFPNQEFCLIMGEDNLASFTKWKNWEQILEYHQLYIYPRPNAKPCELKSHSQVVMVDLPLLEISSSYIRKLIQEKKSIQYLVPEKVIKYIDEMNCYL